MNTYLRLIFVAYCFIQAGCAKDSSQAGDSTSGRGTVNISGKRNTVRNYGASEKGTTGIFLDC